MSFVSAASVSRTQVAVPGKKISVKAVSQRRSLSIMKAAQMAEYIWFDGLEGDESKGLFFNEMRSKTKVVPEAISSGKASDFPQWSFDGSSTGQAAGNNSDCILDPVAVFPDPIRGAPHVLVMTQVMDPSGKPHPTNTRYQLAELAGKPEIAELEPMYGFEQEYTMMSKTGVYGWPHGGFPAPQGPFYCGVGSESAYGRNLAEKHMAACIDAGIKISGINAEVMPGQWEFQVGPVGPLEMSDSVMIARWLLYRLGEDEGITCTLNPKPMKGDWNGTGAHTNFSTKPMRQEGGMEAIIACIEKLGPKHAEHIALYGKGNDMRLTGKHETADIDTFSYGVADRGSSIRIPLPVQLKGYGYLEDRRPAANVDPYTVAHLLLKNGCT